MTALAAPRPMKARAKIQTICFAGWAVIPVGVEAPVAARAQLPQGTQTPLHTPRPSEQWKALGSLA